MQYIFRLNIITLIQYRDLKQYQNQFAYLGAITALQYSQDYKYLLYGCGGCLHIYEATKYELCVSQNVLMHNTIHGIRFFGDYVIVFGQMSFSVLLWDEQAIVQKQSFPVLFTNYSFEDWIWDIHLDSVQKDEHGEITEFTIILGTAHNNIIYYDCLHHQYKQRITGKHRCILYHLSFHYQHEQLYIACATVFNSILLWALNDPETVILIKQHDGVLFHVHWSIEGDYLCSVSDDRTICVYKHVQSPKQSFHDTDHPFHLSLAQDCYSLLFKSYGHENRIWDCIFADNYVVTCSEDKTIRIWNDKGDCVRLYQAKQGRYIWSLCYNEQQHHFVSGGNDGSIKLWAIPTPQQEINQSLDSVFLPTIQSEQNQQENHGLYRDSFTECIRSITMSQDGCYAYISSNWGYLWKYSIKEKSFDVLYQLNDSIQDKTNFKRLSFHSCSQDESCALLFDVENKVTLLSLQSSFPPFQWKYTDKRILNCFWIPLSQQDQPFLLCFIITADCYVYGWLVNKQNGHVFLLYKFQFLLRSCLTCISYIDEKQVLLCGDSNGSLHVFNINLYTEIQNPEQLNGQCLHEMDDSQLQSLLSSFTTRQPDYVLRKVHNHDPITSLLYWNECLYSCGNDGRINLYAFDSNTSTLQKTVNYKIQAMKQISRVFVTWNHTVAICGFMNNEFVLYDLSMNSILHRILCGGWKRPWDLYSSPSSLSYLFLCASTYGHQAIQIHSYAQQQNEENRSLSPLIVPSFHSQEIYACKWIATINSDYSLIVTGGEDRTLKLALVQYHEHQPVSVHIVDTLEGHFTLVKSIAVQQSLDEQNTVYLFSVGGKNSLLIWKIHWTAVEDHSLPVIHYSLLFSHTSQKQWESIEEGENQRFFDVDTWSEMYCEQDIHQPLYFISTVSSDGSLNLFCYHSALNQLEFLRSSTIANQSCLSIKHIVVNSHHMLLIGDTQGHLTTLDVSKDLTHFYQQLPSRSSLPAYKLSTLLPLPFTLDQYFIDTHVHKCGLNSLTVSSDAKNSYTVLSVGDDQSLSVRSYHFDDTGSTPVCTDEQYFSEISSSSLRSISACHNRFVFVGWEQRVFAYESLPSFPTQIKAIGSLFTQVQEPNCIDILYNQFIDKYFVCVVGESGCEIEVLSL